MRKTWRVLIPALFCLSITPIADGEEPPTGKGEKPKVVREEVLGQSRYANEKILRISGRVQVLDAHTLRYEDGTEIDINGGIDAPDLEQRGVIDGKLYPCGKEAAAFLTQLIGDRPVTCYIDTGYKIESKRHRGADALVGETNLGAELARNGWAMSHHSATTVWEVIARDNHRGLWRGQFVFPEKWRKGERLPQEK